MGLIHKVSERQLLEIRNKIFLERGVPKLNQNGFTKGPFSSTWYGRNNLGDYTYSLCRLSRNSYLEFITTHISRGDNWIKIFLNIFQLKPTPISLDDLIGKDALKFSIPPNSSTETRLRMDDIRGIPLFNYDFMFGGHKLKSFRSESGLKKRETELGNLIEKDMTNIDSFVKRWHELHKPNVTDWEGNVIAQ